MQSLLLLGVWSLAIFLMATHRAYCPEHVKFFSRCMAFGVQMSFILHFSTCMATMLFYLYGFGATRETFTLFDYVVRLFIFISMMMTVSAALAPRIKPLFKQIRTWFVSAWNRLEQEA